MKHSDLVSVIIPTKNRRQTLHHAIQSVLNQSHPNLEIIVVDDGSQPAVSLPFTDKRLKILRLESSRGAAAARNAGVAMSHGAFFCFLDDDDTYFKEKIAWQLAYLKEHAGVDLVFSKVCVIDEDGNQRFYLSDVFEYVPFKNFLYFNIIHTNATLYRRRVAELAAFDERLKKYQDMQYHLALTLKANIAYLPETVAVWHQDARGDQLSFKGLRRNYENFRIICQIFQRPIASHRKLRIRYYGRLAYRALRCFDLPVALKSVYWMAFPPGKRKRTGQVTGSYSIPSKLGRP